MPLPRGKHGTDFTAMRSPPGGEVHETAGVDDRRGLLCQRQFPDREWIDIFPVLVD
ncbi:MAG: hypothetical protein ABEH88_12870 [Halobacteriales archaeon]